ncbi:MAG: hypothetical protein ACPG4Z_00815 [Chitinophagales bacterium]
MKKITLILSICAMLFFTACNKQLESDFALLQEENQTLIDSLNQLKTEKLSISQDYGRLLEQTTLMEGVFFEVQIGAFKYFDLSKYNGDYVRLRQVSEESLNKYVLGRFIDYNQATDFKKDIQNLGIEDAFIVAYIDGTRVEIEEGITAAKEMYGRQ